MNTRETDLLAIDRLLQDEITTRGIAAALQGYLAEHFPEDTIKLLGEAPVSALQERVAINIAGLFATECGVGILCKEREVSFTELLEQLVNGKLPRTELLLLCRFANTTWKAGQPLRGWERLKRESFTCFDHLSRSEVEKDEVQVLQAGRALLIALDDVKHLAHHDQLACVGTLLANDSFTAMVSRQLEAAYYEEIGQPVPVQAPPPKVINNRSDQFTAAACFAFYGLECGINAWAAASDASPITCIRLTATGSLTVHQQRFLARFLHAAWKAVLPFSGSSILHSSLLLPFDLLDEVEQDRFIKLLAPTAALLLPHLN